MLYQRIYFNKETGDIIKGNIYSYETGEVQEKELHKVPSDYETAILSEEEIKELENGKVLEIKKGKIKLVEKEIDTIAIEEKKSDVEAIKARKEELRQMIRERKASYEELLEYFSLTF